MSNVGSWSAAVATSCGAIVFTCFTSHRIVSLQCIGGEWRILGSFSKALPVRALNMRRVADS